MSNDVQELYNYTPLSANFNNVISTAACNCGGFVCTTAGSITYEDANGNVIIPLVNVSVGQVFPSVSFKCPLGLKIVLAGGCVGTLFTVA